MALCYSILGLRFILRSLIISLEYVYFSVLPCSLLPFCYLLTLLWRSPMHTSVHPCLCLLTETRVASTKEFTCQQLSMESAELSVESICHSHFHWESWVPTSHFFITFRKQVCVFSFCFFESLAVYPRLTLNSVIFLLYPSQCLAHRCVPPCPFLNRKLLMF